MIKAAELLDTALWALTTQSMGAAIDVIERGLEDERERERCAALCDADVEIWTQRIRDGGDYAVCMNSQIEAATLSVAIRGVTNDPL